MSETKETERVYKTAPCIGRLFADLVIGSLKGDSHMAGRATSVAMGTLLELDIDPDIMRAAYDKAVAQMDKCDAGMRTPEHVHNPRPLTPCECVTCRNHR